MTVGEGFDPDKFLKRSPLKGARVWHRGEKVAESNKLATSNGIEIFLGHGPDLHIDEQQPIALEYLVDHATALKKLVRAPGITGSYLGLQELVYPDSLGSIFDLSPALMKQALKLGLRVTVWSCLSPRPFQTRAKTRPKERQPARAKTKPRSRSG